MKSLYLLIAAFAAASVTLRDDTPQIWMQTGGNPTGVCCGYHIITETQTDFTLIQFTYNDNNVFYTPSGKRFLLPDQLSGVWNGGGRNDTRKLQIVSWSDYETEYIKSEKIWATAPIYDGVVAGGSFSKTQGDISQQLQASINYLAKEDFRLYSFNLEVWPGMPLAPQFQVGIDALPEQYDPVVYGKFLSNYGTHYFVQVQYGAKFNYTAVFDSSLVKKYGQQWTDEQTSLFVGWGEYNAGFNSSTFNSNTQVSQDFSESAQFEKDVVGGDTEAFYAGGGFKDWLKSLEADDPNWQPIVVDSVLAPISDLIADPTKQANVIRALQALA